MPASYGMRAVVSNVLYTFRRCDELKVRVARRSMLARASSEGRTKLFRELSCIEVQLNSPFLVS